MGTSHTFRGHAKKKFKVNRTKIRGRLFLMVTKIALLKSYRELSLTLKNRWPSPISSAAGNFLRASQIFWYVEELLISHTIAPHQQIFDDLQFMAACINSGRSYKILSPSTCIRENQRGSAEFW